jgi:hypothetical protein
VSAGQDSKLTAGELCKAGAALADVHGWSGSAWRRLGSAVPPLTRASVLADIDEMAKRLEEIRLLLACTEFPAPVTAVTGTGWV